MRVSTRSLDSGPSSATTSTSGLPGSRATGALRTPMNSRAFVLAPRPSARRYAVQCTTWTPAARAAGTRRPRFGSISTAAASASAGRAERAPTTPFCTSEVTIAVWVGATRAPRSSGMRPTLSDDPSGDRVGYLTHRQVRDGARDDHRPRLGAAHDRQRRRPRRRAAARVGHVAPGALPGPRSQGRAPRDRPHEAHRRRAVRADLRSGRPAGGLLGLRGPRLHPQAPRRRGGLRPRRHDDVADHLRRDASRAATSPRPASRTW